jgi:hypothetical protein
LPSILGAQRLRLSISRNKRKRDVNKNRKKIKEMKLKRVQQCPGWRMGKRSTGGCWDSDKILSLSLFLLRRWKLQVPGPADCTPELLEDVVRKHGWALHTTGQEQQLSSESPSEDGVKTALKTDS